MKIKLLKPSLLLFTALLISNIGKAQSYTTTIDTFYVSTPEYSATLGLDSLYFPSAITTPNTGNNFPVLILVHGTSALDKDANSTKDYLDSIGASYRKAETHMFYEIADSLSRNGIIVLRYDKRSFTLNCIEKPACWYVDTITPYDYIKDIHNAINFAKNIPLADTCNIFLAGHSQGGSFVSQVGYDRSDIRGVLNMAGTAQPIDSVSIYQEEFVNSNPLGADVLREQFDSLRMGLWPMTDTLYNNHFSPRFWLDWISHTDSAILVQKNSNKPTALMYCTADKFVPPSTHYQIWLDSVTRPNVTFELFSNLDHSFGSEYDSTMSPQVLTFMTNWIESTKINCGSAQIAEFQNNSSLSIYPNPGSNLISVKAINLPDNKFWITNLTGKTIIQGELKTDVPFHIDISHFPKGIYILRTNSTANKFSKY
ncbi:MAG: hypothetical protein Crog4KO_04370 [Crocinitomicaceae bacterium]